MTDDVRVRLSAEGVQEVVDAMKRIRDEAKRTGEEGGKSFAAFKDAIGEVGKELIGFVAIGAVIEKTKELFGEVMNGAVQLDKLHRVTGLSTDALQALSMAAKETSVEQESLNEGLGIFTRNVGLAEFGSKKAAMGFSELGVKVSDLKNMSPDQQFQLIAQKLADVDGKSRRAAIGSQIFGRSFLEIEPAINEVSEQGFGKFLAKLRELGVYMDQDTIRQMRAAKIAAGEIGEEVKGLATQFLAGLMPAVTHAMDTIVKSTQSDGVSAFKKLGEWVGWLVNVVTAGMRVIGTAIGETLGAVTVAAEQNIDKLQHGSVWERIKAAATMATPGAMLYQTAKKADFSNTKKASSEFADAFMGRQDFKLPDEQPIKPGINPGGIDQNAAAVGAARLALIQAQLAAELKLYEAQSKLRENQEQQDYNAGKISLEQYFKDRHDILTARNAEELSILERRRAAIAAQPVDINDSGAGALAKQTQLAAIDGEIAAKKFEQQSTLANLATEQRAAQQKFYSDSLKAEEQLYKIQGDKASAAKLALADELRALDELLKKGGVAEADRAAALQTAAQQGMAKINYDDAKSDADATLTLLNTQIQAIQDKVQSGLLFPIEGERQIIELEKQRLPVLEKTAEEMTKLAAATGDATAISQAAQFSEKVKQIGIATDEAGQQMARLKQTAQDSFQNGLVNFLSDATSGTMTLGEAFRKMAFDIASSLEKVEAEFLAKQFVKWLAGEGQQGASAKGASSKSIIGSIGSLIGGLFGGDKGGGAAGAAASTAATTAQTTAITAAITASGASITAAIAASTTAIVAAIGASAASSSTASFAGSMAGAAAHAAEGGHIRGPGTSTSDSIPAMLSDGEFVVNADAVHRPGVLSLLHAINGTPGYTRASAPGVRRYAEGGLVGGGGIQENHYHADVSELPHHVIQQAVDAAVLNVIAKNPVKVRSSIG